MELKEAIEHAKNKKGMKCSMSGMCKNASVYLEQSTKNDDVDYGAGYAYSLKQMAKYYNEARSAFMSGDLETVAEFFGLYV